MSKTKKALGKGLSALISEEAKPIKTNDDNSAKIDSREVSDNNEGSIDGIKVRLINVDKLNPGRFQPREYFDEKKLKELTDSIIESGVLQPILVRPLSGNKDEFQIVAGERRWRAAKQAGLEVIPAVIRELEDKDALEIALVENIQRQSLTPIEEAEGYKRLIEEFSYTQEQLANNIGKSRSHITNMLRLLHLPKEVKDMINTGALTMGHARALISSENPTKLAYEIISKGLSVRDAEKFSAGAGRVKNIVSDKTKKAKKTSSDYVAGSKDDDLLELEKVLSDNLGLKVSVEDSEEGGRVVLYFNNLSELDKILQKLGS